MTTNIDLYEALRPTVGEDAARMIADVIPPARDLATRLDIERLATLLTEHRHEVSAELAEHRHATDMQLEQLHGEITELRGLMTAGFEAIKAQVEASRTSTLRQVEASRTSTLRWMLTFFLTLWIAILAAAVPLTLRILA